MEFRSIDALLKHFNGDSSALYNESGLMSILNEQAKVLENLVRTNILQYYASYQPVQYVRMGWWIDALKIESISLIGSSAEFSISFDEGMINHPSIFDEEKWPDGNVARLMETGWHINWSKSYRVDRLSDFDGTHYLTNAVAEYNRTNPYGWTAVLDLGEE